MIKSVKIIEGKVSRDYGGYDKSPFLRVEFDNIDEALESYVGKTVRITIEEIMVKDG